MALQSKLRALPPSQIKRLSMADLHRFRANIPTGQIVNRLGGFAVGAWERRRVPSDDGVETYVEAPIEMNANQVRAAIALLNKVMPDLQSVQMEVSTKDTEELSLEQLRARMRALLIGEAVDVEPVQDDLLALDPIDDLLKL